MLGGYYLASLMLGVSNYSLSAGYGTPPDNDSGDISTAFTDGGPIFKYNNPVLGEYSSSSYSSGNSYGIKDIDSSGEYGINS